MPGGAFLVSRSLFLEPRQIKGIPKIDTHAEWCRWLKMHNSLSEDHRRCVRASFCVATHAQQAWRYAHRDASR